MNILRLSTLSLGLAIAVFSLAFSNSSSAKGKDCDEFDTRPKCSGNNDDNTGVTYIVELTEGAFILNQPVTSDGENVLKGDNPFPITRPGGSVSCSGLSASNHPDAAACETWGHVFDVCDLYLINGRDPYGPDAFDVQNGRKGWEVVKWTGGIQIVFKTSFSTPLSAPDDLDVYLRLESDCSYDSPPGCEPFLPDTPDPGESTERTHELTSYWSHARGKGGITHNAPCHVGQGDLVFEGEVEGDPPKGVNSKLKITATKPAL
jgi:hypothetical protein